MNGGVADAQERLPAAVRALATKPFLVGLAVAALAFAGFWELAEDFAASAAVARFDAAVDLVVHGWRSPQLTPLFVLATRVGDARTIVLFTLVAFTLLLRFGRRADAILLVMIGTVGAFLSAVIKIETARPRPSAAQALLPIPTSFSFPSGHALSSVLFFGTLAFVALREIASPARRVAAVAGCALCALLIGTSRVYLGVHWPSDVLASWLLGIAWLSLAFGWFLGWERESLR